MSRTFMFGVSVSGENFTDRVEETRRIKANFENGINTILISPRRMGKTSLVKKVKEIMDSKDRLAQDGGNSLTGGVSMNIKVVYMDIYDCRDESDFYDRFATHILKSLSTKVEQVVDAAKDFLGRLAPKISISPDMATEYAFSLGLKPQKNDAEYILNLPERIGQRRGIHIVVCIDEFQQIGEMPSSLLLQRRIRSVWQHQQHVSYCFLGSKKHMMENLFSNKRMPFYQFGDMLYLGKISTSDWVSYIQSRFVLSGKSISAEMASLLCQKVDNQSSYVQQLAWNVLLETEKETKMQDIDNGMSALIAQNSALFMQQIEGMTSYQLNFIKALCAGVQTGFSSKKVLETYDLGSKSNITRIRKSLIEKELVDVDGKIHVLADPVFKAWFTAAYMSI